MIKMIKQLERRGVRGVSRPHREPSLSLLQGFQTIIGMKERAGKSRTAANYRSAAAKAGVFLGAEAGEFSLWDVSPAWVNEFVAWLHALHPGKPQTVDFYFRNLRALCNHLLRREQASWAGR